MAASEPPHLDESARENACGPMPIRYLTVQKARHQARAPIEQLGKCVVVVVGDPTDQPAQSLWVVVRSD